MMWGYGWGGMGWGMLLFWGLLLAGVIVLARWFTGNTGPGTPPPPEKQSALDILSQRYARGEIDRAEYEQKRRDLSGF